jgi:hypothetical protein
MRPSTKDRPVKASPSPSAMALVCACRRSTGRRCEGDQGAARDREREGEGGSARGEHLTTHLDAHGGEGVTTGQVRVHGERQVRHPAPHVHHTQRRPRWPPAVAAVRRRVVVHTIDTGPRSHQPVQDLDELLDLPEWVEKWKRVTELTGVLHTQCAQRDAHAPGGACRPCLPAAAPPRW